MTLKELVQLVSDMPDVRITFGKNVQEMRDAVTRHASDVVGQVVTAYDWDFTLDVADEATVADQAEYELKGNKDDVRDIVNVRLGATATSTSFELLDKLRAIDMDNFLTDRAASGVHWWYVSGRSDNGYPQITLVATPGTAGNIIRYRYRMKNIGIGAFPDEFSPVLVYAVASRFVPEYGSLYDRELNKMIDRYAAPGGEDDPAPLGYFQLRHNNRRARKYGFGFGGQRRTE